MLDVTAIRILTLSLRKASNWRTSNIGGPIALVFQYGCLPEFKGQSLMHGIQEEPSTVASHRDQLLTSTEA